MTDCAVVVVRVRSDGERPVVPNAETVLLVVTRYALVDDADGDAEAGDDDADVYLRDGRARGGLRPPF